MFFKNILITIFVLFVFETVLIKGQFGRSKPGSCPPLTDINICDVSCFSDEHCEGQFKCCPTACGGTFCTKAVTTRRMQNKVKPGNCPETPTGPWVCSSRCALDSDCRGSKKCCKNRCGAMACSKPEY